MQTARNGFIIKGLILLLALAALVSVPAWGSDNLINILVLTFLYLAFGQTWNLLAGYSGLVSLGQQAFVGLGGYSVAVMAQSFQLPLWMGIAVGGVVSVIFALIISLPIFKMKGVFFTIGTWIVAEALALYFSNWGFVRYGFGFNITAAYQLDQADLYYMAFVIGVGSVALVYFLLRSRLGLALMAMRDNESVAEVRGVKLFWTKLQCFLISAFVGGIAGAVIHIHYVYVQPYAAFSINWTVTMVFIVIIGGIGTIEGPILGAIIYVLLNQQLSNFPGYSMLIFGAVAIVTILLAPKGIMGTIQDKTGFEFFSVRRTIRRPARLAGKG